LHLAASPYGHPDSIDVMQVLLDHGADPNARDINNSTPLHHSSCSVSGGLRGRVESTHLLLKHGAIIDAEDNKGRTPLQLALKYGRDNIATYLKEHGAM
jgi:ankyrin repeat protein